MCRKLMHEVHQGHGRFIETARQNLSHEDCRVRSRPKEVSRILQFVSVSGCDRLRGSRVRQIEDHRHFPQYRPGFVDQRYADAVTKNFDHTVDKDVKPVGFPTLGEKYRSRIECQLGGTCAVVQNRFHRRNPRETCQPMPMDRFLVCADLERDVTARTADQPTIAEETEA